MCMNITYKECSLDNAPMLWALRLESRLQHHHFVVGKMYDGRTKAAHRRHDILLPNDGLWSCANTGFRIRNIHLCCVINKRPSSYK